MLFEMTPFFFKGLGGKLTMFSEHNPPDWMTCKENNWWWKKHVLTLEIGESIDSDFQTIKRLV
jgi:hypothetical protein